MLPARQVGDQAIGRDHNFHHAALLSKRWKFGRYSDPKSHGVAKSWTAWKLGT
jgi:hypothetical protein